MSVSFHDKIAFEIFHRVFNASFPNATDQLLSIAADDTAAL